jgi:tRNA(fMet)-specific endonuclease VapC
MVQETPQVLVPEIVVGELLAGFAVGSRVRENTAVLNQFLAEEFVFEVAVDRGIAEHYATVFAMLRQRGTPIPTNDIWIAACGRATGAVIVTYDEDFTRVPALDVQLLTPPR